MYNIIFDVRWKREQGKKRKREKVEKNTQTHTHNVYKNNPIFFHTELRGNAVDKSVHTHLLYANCVCVGAQQYSSLFFIHYLQKMK